MKSILVVASWLLLFMQNTTLASEVLSSILVKDSVSWDGGSFEYVNGKPEISVQKIDINTSGEEVSLAVHCHTIPLAAYILKGSVKVVKPSGESKLFKAGDAFIEVMNKWHKGVFVENTELIVFYAGKKGIVISFKKGNGSSLSKKCDSLTSDK